MDKVNRNHKLYLEKERRTYIWRKSLKILNIFWFCAHLFVPLPPDLRSRAESIEFINMFNHLKS